MVEQDQIPMLRIVAGYPNYAVSADGDIWRVTRPQKASFNTKLPYRLARHIGQNGYIEVVLCAQGRAKTFRAHRLVLSAFVGPPPTKAHEVAHWNGDKTDNRIENLRWVTRKENMEDCRRHGRLLCGEMNPNAKLSEKDVQFIRSNVKERGDTVRIARELGVSHTRVSAIVLRQSWTCM